MYRGVFSFVCFLIYGVKRRSGGDGSQIYGGKRRSGHDGSQSFGPIWHVSGPEMVFWRNDLMILHHFCWRSSKIKLFWPKTLIFEPKSRKYPKNHKKYSKFLGFPRIFGLFFGFWGYFQDFWSNIKVFNQNNVIFQLLQQKWCRIIRSFVKIPFLDPKRAKLDQNSDFRHLRTLSWLHKLRNTQGKIPPCTWNISRKHIWNISGLYKEYP